MAKKKIQEYISEYLDEYGKNNGYELSRCEFIKEGQTWYLRVYVDKLVNGQYDYMSSDDCEIVSRYLSDRLDQDDPIAQNYYLEVSSPGLDRPLLSDKDFERFAGQAVELKLFKGKNGKKQFSGILIGKTDGIISLKTDDNEELSFSEEEVSKVNLMVVF